MTKRPRYYVFEYEPDGGNESLVWVSHPVFDVDSVQALHAELVRDTGKPARLFEAIGPME